ncbi:hypothetical protein EIP91_004998 [Steccherinum ochraceum]|uniref:F-box domain-containing protein n=1 Tax=Steccherinum ochraceum TaxID=92696 RepID=A0A4V2MVW6_9APHY|nr:hypothetical protein EIP91_004998 [Steccherinum ochraceum]
MPGWTEATSRAIKIYSRLSDDVVVDIMGYNWNDRRTLFQCALVCRQWARATRSVLFRTVFLGGPSGRLQLCSRLEKSELGSWIKELRIGGWRNFWQLWTKFYNPLMPKLENLRRLTVDLTCGIPADAFTLEEQADLTCKLSQCHTIEQLTFTNGAMVSPHCVLFFTRCLPGLRTLVLDDCDVYILFYQAPSVAVPFGRSPQLTCLRIPYAYQNIASLFSQETLFSLETLEIGNWLASLLHPSNALYVLNNLGPELSTLSLDCFTSGSKVHAQGSSVMSRIEKLGVEDIPKKLHDILYGWDVDRLIGLRTLRIGFMDHVPLRQFLPILLCKLRHLHLKTISVCLSFDTATEFNEKNYHSLGMSLAVLINQSSLERVRVEYLGSLPLQQAQDELLHALRPFATRGFKLMFTRAT